MKETLVANKLVRTWSAYDCELHLGLNQTTIKALGPPCFDVLSYMTFASSDSHSASLLS